MWGLFTVPLSLNLFKALFWYHIPIIDYTLFVTGRVDRSKQMFLYIHALCSRTWPWTGDGNSTQSILTQLKTRTCLILTYSIYLHVHRGALLLVPQWQCISSFVCLSCLTESRIKKEPRGIQGAWIGDRSRKDTTSSEKLVSTIWA